MTSEIIGIENDQSQQVIDAATKALNEKGVRLMSTQADPLTLVPTEAWFVGIGNKLMARVHLPSLKDLSNEQIQEKASEIVREVEQKLRSGGDGA